jgi:predicted HTH transcriptional regulator
MSIETLLNGESKNVEYKLTPPSRSINYTKTAVAFANGQGGCLVFGVEDQTLHAIYDDRLEITSPGRLPMGQTIERMKQGYSKIRNEALASAFEYMGYIEHWGSGILRVMQEVRDAGLPEPEFLGGDTDLRINIYRNGSETGIVTGLRRDSLSDDGIVEGATSKTSAAPNAAIAVVPSQKERILDALRKNASISISDAIRILGVQERQAQRILKSLIVEGSAVKIGAARATRYAEAKKRTELHE